MAYFLEKQKTGSTPYIMIDEANGVMTFRGESFHENVVEFYKDVSEWLQRYLDSDFPSFTFNCELAYFNSSTAKLLHNMLMKMDACAAQGKNIEVNWITTEDNEIIIECGEDYQDDLAHLRFKLVMEGA